MKPLQKQIANFNMEQIMLSGQCFRIHKIQENRYSVITGEAYLEVEDFGNGILEFYCTEDEFEKIWTPYFDLDTDYGKIIEDIDPEDSYLTLAGSFAGGIRILQQDLWEMLVTFVISQRMGIPRITSIVEKLCTELGDVHEKNGVLYHSFPTPKQLYEADLSKFSMGYRTKYVSRLAEDVYFGTIDLDFLKEEHAIEEYINYLCAIYGVGIKVANCVILFGMHKLGAFPVDTWISRIVEREYKGAFPVDQYEYAGVLQQYMFYYERMR